MKTQRRTVASKMTEWKNLGARPEKKGFLRVAGSLVAVCSLLSAGCGERSASFSLLPELDSFQQNSAETHGKMDILWVIDNSLSMKSSQENVANNFERFIERFNEKNFDYQLAVTTTEAYLDLFSAQTNYARFRDGTDLTGHSGYHVINPTTPNLTQTFLTNMLQGVAGVGDERAFQSMKQALIYSGNAGFLRPDAFLAVIIISDEDDFSHDGADTQGGKYSYPGLHKTSSYIDWLDQLTKSGPGNRNYNVSTIGILDEPCLNMLNASIPGRKIARRHQEISNATNGVIGSLCGDFGTTLSEISNRIIELSTQFYLSRVPVAGTLVIYIDGQVVPEDPTNGYQYHGETNSVTFHGSYVPGPGALINVGFDPTSLK